MKRGRLFVRILSLFTTQNRRALTMRVQLKVRYRIDIDILFFWDFESSDFSEHRLTTPRDAYFHLRSVHCDLVLWRNREGMLIDGAQVIYTSASMFSICGYIQCWITFVHRLSYLSLIHTHLRILGRAHICPWCPGLRLSWLWVRACGCEKLTAYERKGLILIQVMLVFFLGGAS